MLQQAEIIKIMPQQIIRDNRSGRDNTDDATTSNDNTLCEYRWHSELDCAGKS